MSYKTVLVTGASAGFGYAICDLLASEGYRVIAAARREDKLQSLAKKHGDSVFPLKLDVTDKQSVASVLERIPDSFRPVDVLINNAGLALGQDKAFRCLMSDWQTMVDTNITGLLSVTHAILPSMVERNVGYIINLGSTAGRWPYTGGNVYGGTKAFVEQFSNNLRTDLAGTALKVTVIKPGLCSDTEFSSVRFKGDSDKVAAVYKDTQSILPEDIANTVLYLLRTPARLNINELEMMPVCQTFGGLSVTRNLDLNEKK
ncbi:MAG: SDR family NAD(P)-dependent oxidoreductase [Succinivibrio sp.]